MVKREIPFSIDIPFPKTYEMATLEALIGVKKEKNNLLTNIQFINERNFLKSIIRISLLLKVVSKFDNHPV